MTLPSVKQISMENALHNIDKQRKGGGGGRIGFYSTCMVIDTQSG